MVRLKVRIFVLVLSILVVCMGNALAMQFYQPEELGYISFYMAQNGGAYFQGESNVIGQYHRSSVGRGREYYGQGIVKYGSGRDVIYIHYDTTEPYYCNARVGSKDIGNTVEVFLQSDTLTYSPRLKPGDSGIITKLACLNSRSYEFSPHWTMPCPH